MFYIINMMKKHLTLLYWICTYDTKKVTIWTSPQSICRYVPVVGIELNDLMQ